MMYGGLSRNWEVALQMLAAVRVRVDGGSRLDTTWCRGGLVVAERQSRQWVQRCRDAPAMQWSCDWQLGTRGEAERVVRVAAWASRAGLADSGAGENLAASTGLLEGATVWCFCSNATELPPFGEVELGQQLACLCCC